MKMAFLTEKDALWRMAIKDFYGEDGGLFFSDASHGSSGVWVDILKAIAKIENIVPSFRNSFVRKIANGSSISFWKDVWCNLGVLEWRIPIRGRVADDMSHLVELIGNNSFFL
ncbi:hypothetical protein Tco_0508796 [Tanacetum coccineum]